MTWTHLDLDCASKRTWQRKIAAGEIPSKLDGEGRRLVWIDPAPTPGWTVELEAKIDLLLERVEGQAPALKGEVLSPPAPVQEASTAALRASPGEASRRKRRSWVADLLGATRTARGLDQRRWPSTRGRATRCLALDQRTQEAPTADSAADRGDGRADRQRPRRRRAEQGGSVMDNFATEMLFGLIAGSAVVGTAYLKVIAHALNRIADQGAPPVRGDGEQRAA